MPKSRGRKKKKSRVVGTVRVGDEVLPLLEEARDALLRQKETFKAKFGREPGPNDPIFFDPNQDVPAPYPDDRMRRETLEAMRKAGSRAEIIYAYSKTGLLIMEGVDYPANRRKEWNNAIDEYFELERKAEEQKE